jgi:hypothetical protein
LEAELEKPVGLETLLSQLSKVMRTKTTVLIMLITVKKKIVLLDGFTMGAGFKFHHFHIFLIGLGGTLQ